MFVPFEADLLPSVSQLQGRAASLRAAQVRALEFELQALQAIASFAKLRCHHVRVCEADLKISMGEP